MADVDLTPTAEMARNAERGLELRREHGRGGTEVGVARARDISNGKTLSPETVRRMHAFFSRHAKNKAGGEDDAGYIAWMLWSGDAGRDWAKRKVDELDRKERNAMSETRKAIMERLGMAAMSDRPGAKAKMGKFKVGDRVAYKPHPAQTAGELIEIRKPTSLEGVEMQYGIKQASGGIMWVPEGMVVRASRPGAKAKMGAPDPTRKADAFTPAQRAEQGRYLTAMYKLSAKAAVLASDLRNLSDRAQQYAKMLASEGVVTQELGRRMDELLQSFMPYSKIPMSRPGAKAKMAYGVASAAPKFIKGDTVVDAVHPNRRGKVVEVMPGRYDAKSYTTAENEYIVDFEPKGGLVRYGEKRLVRASRPGAKAKMAADAGMVARAIAEHNRQRRAYEEAKERLEALVRLGHSEQRIQQAERGVQLAEERMNEAAKALKNLNTRPGAKVRAALADACWEGYEAVGTKPQDGKTVPNCVPKATAAKDTMSAQQAVAMNVDRAEQAIARGDRDAARRHIKAAQDAMDDSVTAAGLRKRLEQLAQRYKMAKPAEGDLEREDVKAGLKLMSASDPAVSDKIRTLIKEGKPQEQAVAIALDMKRRGEL